MVAFIHANRGEEAPEWLFEKLAKVAHDRHPPASSLPGLTRQSMTWVRKKPLDARIKSGQDELGEGFSNNLW